MPGLIISLLGIYFVSQQKRARILNVNKELSTRLAYIRDTIETKTQQLIESVFFSVSEVEIDFSNSTGLMKHTKRIAVNNPVVKNPFFISSEGKYLFPFSKKTTFPDVTLPYRQVIDRTRKNSFIKGENLEFKERKFVEAIRLYLKYLKENRGKRRVFPYVYNAIARCYFKTKKYQQAVGYYRQILRRYPDLLQEDKSLHFLVLRQIAFSYKLLKKILETGTFYLDLYENVLDYESSDNSNPFEFFKNEALAYLNLYTQEDVPGKDRFSRAKEKDRLENASALDISLGWMYFESDTDERQLTSRFLTLRELYTANDEKTAFYKTLKNLDEWSLAGAEPAEPAALNIKQVRIPPANIPVDICIKKIRKNFQTYKDIFFGFMISFEFIQRDIIPGLIKENLDDDSLKLSLEDRGGAKDNAYKHELLSVPFRRVSLSKVLVLYSNRQDYVEWVVEKETRLLYGLMSALMVALFLGLFILYKYITRETELVRLKADFVDSVSHTLKSPLTRMALMAENVQQGWVTEENQKQAFLQTIVHETALMNEMIDNMLDFSKIEAGKKQYYFQVSSLPEVVGTVKEHYAGYLEKTGFELNVQIQDDLPAFELDREAVRLIVANLIQNAVKYSHKEKEKYIAVRVYREKGFAVIEVEDRGIGIAEKDLTDIFKKFYRVPGSEVKAREGSGLGLFIARHAVAAHNGEIRVKSQIGRGSTFTVYLPIRNSPRTNTDEHG